jgi:CRISPR/Cas system-associated protein Cas10 (large subunit of type III CRISPR-Cas system)
MRIVITASGIQDYIFDITQRAASTRLRGRSARLGLVLDRCHQRIHEAFEGKFKVRRNAGSRLEVEVDSSIDSEKVTALVNHLQSDLDRYSIKELDSQVWFTAVTGTPGDGIYQKLAKQKLQPGRAALQVEDQNWDALAFRFKRNIDERKYQREEGEARELPEARLGRTLAREGNDFFYFTKVETGTSIPILDDHVVVAEPASHIFGFTLKGSPKRPNLIHKRVCRYAPMDDQNQRLLHLGEIAERSKGAKFLGVLKADLDNAGTFLNNCSEERRQELSPNIDAFFTEKLEGLVRERYRNCYIVYSGGDDLFMLGPWDQLLGFAEELQKELAKVTAEWNAPQLTLSAGFKLTHPSSPVRYLVDDADAALENAKKSGKNCVSVFERLLKWDELAEGMEWGEEFQGTPEGRKLSISFLQRLQYYAGESRRFFERGELDALSMIPLLQNDWSRNRDQVEQGLRQKLETRMLPFLKQLNNNGERMWRIADFAARFACYALR